MAQSEEIHELDEVVRELSPQALKHLSGLGFLRGKFVRLGDVIVIGSTDVKINTGGFIDHLTHRDLMGHGRDDMGDDVTRRIKATKANNDEYLHNGWSLADAGRYRIEAGDDGQPKQFALSGESRDYGRVADPGRQRTGELARVALGSEISVVVE